MSLTYVQAIQEMKAHMRSEWGANPIPFYIEKSEKPEKNSDLPETYVEFDRFQHLIGNQATLGSEALYDREGLFFIFVVGKSGVTDPNLLQYTDDEVYRIADQVTKIFEGKSTPGGVWFRDTRVSENSRVAGRLTDRQAIGSDYIGEMFGPQEFQIIGEFSYQQLRGESPP